MRFAIIAGEASGDLLGGGLIKALKQLHPEAEFVGMAGPRMIEQGCQALRHIDELSVMGFTEVLKQLPRLLRMRKQLAEYFIANPPDVLIGIDAPDFNLMLERKVREKGIPTVHYVSPSVWAWRQGRVKGIARSVDLMLTLLPFEADFYRQHNVAVEFVGHPLANEISQSVDAHAVRRELGLPDDSEQAVLALLPGSRRGEVSVLIRPFIEAAVLSADQVDGLICIIPAANKRTRVLIDDALAEMDTKGLEVRVIDGHSHEAMAAANVVLLASGTATLEATLLHRPMVMGYKVSKASFLIYQALGLDKNRAFTLPNLLSGSRVVPEHMQDNVQPERLAKDVVELFLSETARNAQVDCFQAIHRSLRQNANVLAAKAITRLIEEKPA